ncbi:MAG: PTS sugar transporter subunit IIB [Erysipelotrichaceae bacterium]|nr:PTS sugar transporter subunit IIB [Erysipelotrichaceae bacterium]
MSIGICRIDEKLIHGQTASQWAHIDGVNRIYVIDDDIAHNDFLSRVFVSAAPAGTNVKVWDTATAVEKMKKVEAHPTYRAFILCATPTPYVKMVDAGVGIKNICVGNMGNGPDKLQMKPACPTYASKAQRDEFRYLVSKGVNVYLQVIPQDAKVNVMDCPAMKADE